VVETLKQHRSFEYTPPQQLEPSVPTPAYRRAPLRHTAYTAVKIGTTCDMPARTNTRSPVLQHDSHV
jgi:hypothetical protein